MAGINGVGSEVVKNIVLSGVKSMTLLDHQMVTEADTLSNLFTKREIGQNRAKVSKELVQSLNPNVAVNDDNTSLRDKDKDFFRAYEVVILSNYDKQTMIKVNRICNELNIKFFATAIWGSFGFTFTDLGSQHYYFSEEDVKIEDITIQTDCEPTRKKARLEAPQQQQQPTPQPITSKQIVEKKISFVSLERALDVKAGKAGYGLTRRTSSTFIITHILLEFCEKHSRYPSADSRDEDIEELKGLQKEVIARLGVDERIIKHTDWHKEVFGELSPISSIVGGVLGQDVIRAVSAKDSPIRNFFLFDGIQCNGSIESIGK
ncbi:unnamed protein product [Medioppia subpectinata]|uniref:THIF-type NAD/FAD binding fold domain-containing protein n=1 Tax=Medioppia subpectinata TaxID=1979941 RepID=A0A7R9KN63_9ACAR|nr:unnamed protein product [Medioppia subpectinata]CAG2106614.1 unnamed protein product [Medioppia subpectinata]